MFQSKVYLRKYGMILDGTKIVELKLLGRKVKNSKYNYRGFATKFAQISGGKPINTGRLDNFEYGNPKQNVKNWLSEMRRYSNPSTNFNENTEKVYTPINPLTFENNKCLIYKQNEVFRGQAFMFLGTLSVNALFAYMTYRSIIGPSGIIMKALKLLISFPPILFFAPFCIECYKSYTGTIRSIYLEENGEYIQVYHSIYSKRFKIKDVKMSDKATYNNLQETRTEVTDKFVPINIKEFVFYLDRDAIYLHKDIINAILHSNIVLKDNDVFESSKVYSKINTAGFESDKVKDIEATQLTN